MATSSMGRARPTTRSSTVLGHDRDHASPVSPTDGGCIVDAEAGDVVDLLHSEALAALDAVRHQAPGEHGGVGQGEAAGEVAPSLRRAHATGVDRPAASTWAGETNCKVNARCCEQTEQLASAKDGGGAPGGRRSDRAPSVATLDVGGVDRTADHDGELGHQQTSGQQGRRGRERVATPTITTSSARALLGQRPAHAGRVARPCAASVRADAADAHVTTSDHGGDLEGCEDRTPAAGGLVVGGDPVDGDDDAGGGARQQDVGVVEEPAVVRSRARLPLAVAASACTRARSSGEAGTASTGRPVYGQTTSRRPSLSTSVAPDGAERRPERQPVGGGEQPADARAVRSPRAKRHDPRHVRATGHAASRPADRGIRWSPTSSTWGQDLQLGAGEERPHVEVTATGRGERTAGGQRATRPEHATDAHPGAVGGAGEGSSSEHSRLRRLNFSAGTSLCAGATARDRGARRRTRRAGATAPGS